MDKSVEELVKSLLDSDKELINWSWGEKFEDDDEIDSVYGVCKIKHPKDKILHEIKVCKDSQEHGKEFHRIRPTRSRPGRHARNRGSGTERSHWSPAQGLHADYPRTPADPFHDPDRNHVLHGPRCRLRGPSPNCGSPLQVSGSLPPGGTCRRLRGRFGRLQRQSHRHARPSGFRTLTI